MADKNGTRHSVASTADLIEDENEKAKQEALNGLLQFDCAKFFLMSSSTRKSPSIYDHP